VRGAFIGALLMAGVVTTLRAALLGAETGIALALVWCIVTGVVVYGASNSTLSGERLGSKVLPARLEGTNAVTGQDLG